jgi:hypothetical protein
MLGVETDPGTDWHPKRILGRLRNLPDLTDRQVHDHLRKPEADPDDRYRDAEGSTETPEDVV